MAPELLEGSTVIVVSHCRATFLLALTGVTTSQVVEFGFHSAELFGRMVQLGALFL